MELRFASDFVTFRIPGYGRGYGGPWPPDRAPLLFTLYALKDRSARTSPIPPITSTSFAPCFRRNYFGDPGWRLRPRQGPVAERGLT